jgi:hypothetical protein
MSKLYIFGIGGTGSRVLKALTMMLASGVKCNFNTIVPIIIDPDAAAADVSRSTNLMGKYISIRNELDYTTNHKNKFFQTNIEELFQNFRLPVKNSNVSFGQYIGVNTMSSENKALTNMLFSQDNLKAEMEVGFKGNPNIGSVVLNQFSETGEFKKFANDFCDGDRVFIISSIFGGTGASGFPLLLKTLRSDKTMPAFALINNAPIGAITVLPYFKVNKDDDSVIDSSTFISKTKAALSYYENNINNLNALYYIADEDTTSYDNKEGGIEQKNKAHFVELAAALAILDFANSPVEQGKYKEYGIENGSSELCFSDLGNLSQQYLKKPLSAFMLMSKYFKENGFSDISNNDWAKDVGLDTSFFSSQFFSNLKTLQEEFINWLNEMDNQTRKFTPFELMPNSSKVFDYVKDVPEKSIKWPVWKAVANNYDLVNAYLNHSDKVTGSFPQKLMDLFYTETESLINEKLNIN